jgi:lysozyme
MAKSKNNFLSQIKWGESYTSLILGAIVVLVAVALLFLVARNNNDKREDTGTGTATSTEGETYTVKEGDDLWKISEDLYGSGYNWEDLAKANDISNPNVIEPGTKLSVPEVATKEATIEPVQPQANKITGTSYTVVEGDYLWDIAIRAYGDGYKWTHIAETNAIANPDIIYVGTKLNLPR